MDTIFSIIKKMNAILWNGPLLFLLLGIHLLFTIRLGFIQKKIKSAIHLSFSNDSDSNGNASSFSTLTTTLAATLGTGNIVGISTAIALGGPGAVFWCWITGILGMATTYAESYLSLCYRKKNSEGVYYGGPMYVMEYGLKSKPLAIFYAICTVLTAFFMGCSTQAKAITDVTSTISLSPYISGLLVALFIGIIIIKGAKKIQALCLALVPAMAILYVFGCVFVLLMNWNYIFPSIALICKSAFQPHAIAGGLFGQSILLAARYGVSRGLFTNEAGLGSAAIAACDSKNEAIKEQALVSMSATFWDTVVMCAVTGIVIISAILRSPNCIVGLSDSEYTTAAFSQIPHIGSGLLGVSLICFALATLIGWSYLGEKAVRYLLPSKGIPIYHLLYLIMIYLGSVLSLDVVWETSDLVNAFLILPNVLALFLLRKKIKA